MQNQGFLAISVNYPQDSFGDAFPKESNAIEAAANWAITNARSYGGNPKNIILLGGSAGGQLVGIAADHLNAAQPGAVAGVVSLSGPENLVSLAQEAQNGELNAKIRIAVTRALGCTKNQGCPQTLAAEESPIDHIPTSSCPAWFLAGSQNDIVPIAQQSEMLKALQADNCQATLDVVPSGHSFEYWKQVAPAVLKFIREN